MLRSSLRWTLLACWQFFKCAFLCTFVLANTHGPRYNPIKTIKTNAQGTLNMLGLARRVNARVLLASTSEVYGDPEVHPQTEDYRGALYNTAN